jgi:hypothetical protein
LADTVAKVFQTTKRVILTRRRRSRGKEDSNSNNPNGGQVSAVDGGTNTITLTGTAQVALNSVLATVWIRKSF